MGAPVINPGKYRPWRRLTATAAVDATGRTNYTYSEAGDIFGYAEDGTARAEVVAASERQRGEKSFYFPAGTTLERGDRIRDRFGVTWDVVTVTPADFEYVAEIAMIL